MLTVQCVETMVQLIHSKPAFTFFDEPNLDRTPKSVGLQSTPVRTGELGVWNHGRRSISPVSLHISEENNSIELVEWNEITITSYISIASQAIEEKRHLKLDRRKDILTRQFTWQSCPESSTSGATS